MCWDVLDTSPLAISTEMEPRVRQELTHWPTRALSEVLRPQMVRRVQHGGVNRGRCLYVPGPGDVAGTHWHWKMGQDDPSIPALAYSAQVYELAEVAAIDLTVLSELPTGAAPTIGPVRFRHLPHPGGAGWRYHLREIGYALSLIRAARRAEADTILIQRMLTHFWPLAIARFFNIRLVCSLHNTLWPIHRDPTRRERFTGWLNAIFFRRCAAVIGVSEAICDQVRTLCGCRQAAVAMQVPQYDARAIQVREIPERLTQLQYLGRIEEAKGVFLLLEAFAKVAPTHPLLRLRFTGDGGAIEALRSAAVALPTEIARRVDIPGPCDGAGVRKALADSDLLICPTTSRFAEGLAKTPIEAALAGVPSLLSDVVPVASLLGRAAQVVPCDDTLALAQAIDRLARDPSQLWAMARSTANCRDLFTDRRLSLASRLAQALLSLPEVARDEAREKLTAVNFLPDTAPAQVLNTPQSSPR